jgi:hypothetical protein
MDDALSNGWLAAHRRITGHTPFRPKGVCARLGMTTRIYNHRMSKALNKAAQEHGAR